MSTFSLNCKGRLVSLNTPIVMGIINATPDSFFSTSRKPHPDEALETAVNMIEAGAKMIDIGGQSTRPGSTQITKEEELDRLLPLIIALHATYPEVIISIDTYYASVAKATIEAGAHIINDISGGLLDPDMIPTVGAFKHVPFVCMHMKGTPQNMSSQNHYNHMMAEIIQYFVVQKQQCHEAGIKDVIIDPGFGFAKNLQQNFELMRQLSQLEILNCPILVGISRKGMIQKILQCNAAQALNGTTVLNTMALMNGAHILRVHDVKEAQETITLVNAYHNAQNNFTDA